MNNVKNSWSQKAIIKFISENRKNYNSLYIGERILLDQYFKKNYSVLDIGCAQGGFINILKKINKKFTYVGIDYNKKMLDIAKKRYPNNEFVYTKQNDYSKYIKKKFDLVIIFGILHLNKEWKKIIKEAYKLSKRYLIFDLRESNKIIKKKIYLNLGNKKKIPYYIIKRKEVENFLKKEFRNKEIIKLSYDGLPSKYSNYRSKITFGNYCINR